MTCGLHVTDRFGPPQGRAVRSASDSFDAGRGKKPLPSGPRCYDAPPLRRGGMFEREHLTSTKFSFPFARAPLEHDDRDVR